MQSAGNFPNLHPDYEFHLLVDSFSSNLANDILTNCAIRGTKVFRILWNSEGSSDQNSLPACERCAMRGSKYNLVCLRIPSLSGFVHSLLYGLSEHSAGF